MDKIKKILTRLEESVELNELDAAGFPTTPAEGLAQAQEYRREIKRLLAQIQAKVDEKYEKMKAEKDYMNGDIRGIAHILKRIKDA